MVDYQAIMKNAGLHFAFRKWIYFNLSKENEYRNFQVIKLKTKEPFRSTLTYLLLNTQGGDQVFIQKIPGDGRYP
jgi:hypothetical protein